MLSTPKAIAVAVETLVMMSNACLCVHDPSQVLKCRFIGEGLGLSIVMLTQTYKANAVPRALRLNLTHLAVFKFKTYNKQELRNIYEEVGAMCSEDEFMAAYEAATAEKHGYLWCDFIKRTLGPTF